MCQNVHTSPHLLRELGTAVTYNLQLSQLRLREVQSLACSQQLAVVWALSLTGRAGPLARCTIPRSALRPSPDEREHSSGIGENPGPTRPACRSHPGVSGAGLGPGRRQGRVGKANRPCVNPTAPSFSFYLLPLGNEAFALQCPQAWGLQAEEFLSKSSTG